MPRDKTDKSPDMAFAAAVQRSKEFIQSALERESAPRNPKDIEWSEGVVRVLGERAFRKRLGKLQAWAVSDATAFDIVRGTVANILDRGEELPLEARDWLVKYLRGEVIRPNEKRGRKSEFRMHLLIFKVVKSLVNEGMNMTRNPGSPSTSACDAVARALKELQLTPTTHDGVRKIYTSFRGYPLGE